MTTHLAYARGSIRTLPFGADIAEVMTAMNSDGAVILEDFLDLRQIAALNADIEPRIKQLSKGTYDSHEDERYKEYFGKKTRRLSNLTAWSTVFREEILPHAELLRYIDALLAPVADTYWLSAAQVIDILPGEKAQILHRELDVYPAFRTLAKGAPEMSPTFMVALSEYTAEVGATRIIPGSHLWTDFSDCGTPEMTIAAELRPGSGLLFSSKIVHGGGHNQTADRARRALALAYNPGWTTPEEAHPLTIPLEIARTLPPRAQQLLGFRSHYYKATESRLWSYNYHDIADYLKLS
jgi:ectoine hydroxylase-related dioxygenase (phytanoyl-CoA dioxygenase family)